MQTVVLVIEVVFVCFNVVWVKQALAASTMHLAYPHSLSNRT